jgi:hypothetical protein
MKPIGTTPAGQGASAGLSQINRPRPYSLTEILTIAAIAVALVVMVALDAAYFPGFSAAEWATILGAEAEAWVAIVLGIEVWFTFLRWRSGAEGSHSTHPGAKPIPADWPIQFTGVTTAPAAKRGDSAGSTIGPAEDAPQDSNR